MREFAKMSPRGKVPFYTAAAESVGLPVHIIEKDYWVTWLLDILFTMDEIKDQLTFKGGTSLSKVYNQIRRFSEDVDLSIEKAYFGFSGDRNPIDAESKKKAKKLIVELNEKCKDFVQIELKNKLELAIEKELSSGDWSCEMGVDWRIEVDTHDSDGQTLLFYYPTFSSKENGYVLPSVKIEMGARADHWPVEMHEVSSYLAQGLPKTLNDSNTEIRVLSVERTFWEKATILHMYGNFPDDKMIPIRQSRHYYDFYCLLSSEAKIKAMDRIDLLEKVAQHKEVYFRSGWADYDSAKDKKTLKLIPSVQVLEGMKKDYSSMGEMFFEEPPDWNQVIALISDFENSLRE